MLDMEELTQAVGKLEEDDVIGFLDDFVSGDPSVDDAQEAVVACQKGMNIVGDLFEKGEYFIGDLIFSGELLTRAVNILKPVLGNSDLISAGTIVLGTAHGDLHDIGKNIFKNMAKAAGFEVIDLGVDVAPEIFVEKVKEYKPQIVGMSGVLTLTIDAMKATVDALKAINMKVKIIIGGHLVSEETCEYVGADGCTNNAAEGVKICQEWV